MKKGVISVLSALTGAVIGAGAIGKITMDRTQEFKAMSDKHLALFLLMNKWVRVKQERKSLFSYFEKNGYRKIAVYGMSYVGETLVDELRDTGIEIAYGIDKRADSLYADVDIVSVDDALGEVDAVVVTAVTFFDEIEAQLEKKLDCPIVSLEDVLYEI